MYIIDKELKIRNAESDDAMLLSRWWNDGNVMAHAGFPNGLGTNEEAVKKQLATDSDEAGRRLIIEIESTPVGEMNYRTLEDGSAEIGIKICESEYQEKGYGTRLLRLFIHELFSMRYEKIVLDTNLKNVRAQHVYEKLGFVKKGIRMDSWRDQLGVLQSAVYYELIRD